jgi:hypothetical protein
VAFTGVFGGQFLNIVADLQFNLGPTFSGLDVLQALQLRRYVDPWLNTGITKDGSEVPSRRTLRGDPYIAVQDYMEKYPPTVGLYERGLEVHMGEPFGLPYAPEQLFESIELNAKRLFTGLIASDWNGRFGKCRYPACGCYFVRPKLRHTYKHGIFCCREHQLFARATVSTRHRRTAAHRELIAQTANQLIAWKVKDDQWQANVKVKRRLAVTISKYVRTRTGLLVNQLSVQLNWITRHQKEIEQARVEASGML